MDAPDRDRLAAALADRYTLVRELGGGGMAHVWLAREVALDRDVVIKLVRDALGDTAQALTALEESARRGNLGVNIPLGSQIYDPLRTSPRFAAIVRSLGLDVALFTSPNGGRPR